MSGLPYFPCPKCAAVADVVFAQERAQAEVDDCRRRHAEYITRPGFHDSVAALIRDQLLAAMAGLDGPWLNMTCPRCRYGWRERPLDARDSPTPIYDGMASA